MPPEETPPVETPAPEAGAGETAPESPTGEETPPQPGADGAEDASGAEEAAGAEEPETEPPERGGRKGWIPQKRAEEMARRRVEKAVAERDARFRAFLQANREHFDPDTAAKRAQDRIAEALIKTLRPDIEAKPKRYYTVEELDEILQRHKEDIVGEATKQRELQDASHQLESLEAKYPDVFQAFPDLPEILSLRWGSKAAVEAGLSMTEVGEKTILAMLKGTDSYAKRASQRRTAREEEGGVLTPQRPGAAPAPKPKKPEKEYTFEDAEADVDRYFDRQKRGA